MIGVTKTVQIIAVIKLIDISSPIVKNLAIAEYSEINIE